MPSSSCDRGVSSGSLRERTRNTRDGRGALGSRLAAVKTGAGEDWDTLLRGPDHRARKESPSDMPFWANKVVVGGIGNLQNKELSLEMKNDLSEIDLLLLNGKKMLPYLSESLGRNSASAASLSCVPVEGCFAEVCSPAGQALVGATNHFRERCPWMSHLPCLQEPNRLQLEMGIFARELWSAFLKGMGSELELSGLHSIIAATLFWCPGELLSDETKYVFVDSLKPRFSEQTIEYKKMFPGVKSVSDDLLLTMGLLAP